MAGLARAACLLGGVAGQRRPDGMDGRRGRNVPLGSLSLKNQARSFLSQFIVSLSKLTPDASVYPRFLNSAEAVSGKVP